MNDRDPEGVHLHNALWSAPFAGWNGTPMLWWWDNYIEPQDLYGRYQGLSRFLKGVDWSEPWVPARAESARLRLLTLSTGHRTLLWLQDRRGTWFERLVRGTTPARLSGGSITLRGLKPGRYTVRWFNTWKGSWEAPGQVTVQGDKTRLSVPPWQFDIAARIDPITLP